MEKENKISFKLIIGLVIVLFLIVGFTIYITHKANNGPEMNFERDIDTHYSYRLSGNKLEDFDLSFLKMSSEYKANMVYSPLSIKYALEMLAEGSTGETHKQLMDILGDYTPKKYTNSANMSFANAMFIKNTYKDSIKKEYVDNLLNKFNAEVVYDSFENPNGINSWVSNKTFKLIGDLADDVSNLNYVLVNALAIDMEWNNKIQSTDNTYVVDYAHENYFYSIYNLLVTGYNGLDFKGYNKKAKSVEVGAVANRYDIVNTLGEDKIRETVGAAYKKYLEKGGTAADCGYEPDEPDPDVETYVNTYINELKKNYLSISSSTDFSFYNTEDFIMFAKDLKKYDGVTLQYVALMPKNVDLSTYLEKINAYLLNVYISALKPIDLDSFIEGRITEVSGYIPMFKYDYELNLIEDLVHLGVTDVFDPEKADLSNLSTEKSYIGDVKHKANIEFSNEGIKAAAATEVGGAGAGMCGFDYKYEVPVQKIDLTFDKPFMYIIRDKDSGEVWFVGSVYEPLEMQEIDWND